MEHRKVGKSGLKVSSLCLGAMTFGESQGFMKGVTSPDEEARRVLDRALEAGIDFVDTADMYSDGRSEELLGQWLGSRRKDVILATKCRFQLGAPNPDRPMSFGLSRRHIIESCEGSLRRLKTEWIDLYQVHMQDASVPLEETLRALDDLVHAGKVRYIGCSNFTGYRLTESLWVSDHRNLARFESVQAQWHLLERGVEREVIPACREYGLGVLVWSPLARGLLSGKYDREKGPPKGSRMDAWKESWASANVDRTWNVLEGLRGVANEVQASPAQVAIAWLLHKPQVSAVILGARTVQQLEDNLGAARVKLSPEQVRRLDELSRPQWGYPYDFISVREPW